MIETPAFDRLTALIEETKISYPEIEFPIVSLGDGKFRALNGLVFGWEPCGAAYVAERNPAFNYSDFSRPLIKKQYDVLAARVNIAMGALKAGKNLRYQAALYNGKVVGILRQYSPVFHRDLLTAIKHAGLSTNVVGGYITVQKFVVDVDIHVEGSDPDVDADGLHVGIRIVNGHSGHCALHYKLLVKSRGFEYTRPLRNRARHMTGITEMVAALQDALNSVAEQKLDQLLLRMSAQRTLHKIRMCYPFELSEKQEQILHYVEHSESVNGVDVFVMLGQLATTKGSSTSVNKMLEYVVSAILDDPSTAYN